MLKYVCKSHSSSRMRFWCTDEFLHVVVWALELEGNC